MYMFKKISLFILLLIYPFKAIALIEVDITRGNLDPLPLAVSPLSIDEKSKKEFQKILKKENIGSEISIIVENNLKTSGLFDPLSKDAFLLTPSFAILTPNFNAFEGEIREFFIFLRLFSSLDAFSLNIIFLSSNIKSISIPFWVSLISALSDLKDSLYSALEVNIL